MCTFSTSERQKRLKNLSFLHSWLGNVLRAARACTFSTSERQKVVWTWCVFWPSWATNHWKNSESRLSYLFAHLPLLSSLSFSSLIFSLLFFSSLTLPTAFPSVHMSEVWLLNFLRLYLKFMLYNILDNPTIIMILYKNILLYHSKTRYNYITGVDQHDADPKKGEWLLKVTKFEACWDHNFDP